MDIEEYGDLIVRAGRVSYKCSFDGTDYTEEDSTRPDGPRVRAPREESNAWSSLSRMGARDGIHLPVFDVDLPPETHRGEVTLQDIVADMFAGNPIEWVPSTTEGHFHVYVEAPYTWEDYLVKLDNLVDWGVIERGYWKASKHRKATFVRMPHVKKGSPLQELVVALNEPF